MTGRLGQDPFVNEASDGVKSHASEQGTNNHDGEVLAFGPCAGSRLDSPELRQPSDSGVGELLPAQSHRMFSVAPGPSSFLGNILIDCHDCICSCAARVTTFKINLLSVVRRREFYLQ